MKKSVLVLLFVVLIIGVHTCARGAPVQFFVVNDPHPTEPNQVTLTTTSFLPTGFKLQFNYSGVTDWTDFETSQTFYTGDNRYELVYLKLYNEDESTEDTTGDLTFQGYETPDDSYSLGWYNTLIIDWGEPVINSFELTIATAGDDDNIAPASTPIPHSALLLGSGIFGLVVIGFRRRAKKE